MHWRVLIWENVPIVGGVVVNWLADDWYTTLKQQLALPLSLNHQPLGLYTSVSVVDCGQELLLFMRQITGHGHWILTMLYWGTPGQTGDTWPGLSNSQRNAIKRLSRFHWQCIPKWFMKTQPLCPMAMVYNSSVSHANWVMSKNQHKMQNSTQLLLVYEEEIDAFIINPISSHRSSDTIHNSECEGIQSGSTEWWREVVKKWRIIGIII